MLHRFALFALAGAGTLLAASPTEVTFSKHVAPILQRSCQGCHRTGEAAPMPLITYGEARPWAKAIREAVLLKRMPPWHADPHYGQFSNDRSLSREEIATVVNWVNAGAPEGDPKDLPPPARFVDGWNIGTPDMEFEMPKAFPVPVSGTIEYHYMIVPTRLTEDKWIQKAEIRPGNRAVLHHAIAFIRPPDAKWLRDYPVGEAFIPNKRRRGGGSEFLVGYAPGTMPEVLEPGRGKLIKAGSDIVFQLHYTANGKAAEDRSKLGLIYAKQPVQERVLTLQASNGKFVIPPGEPNHRVDSQFTLKSDAILLALFPHMHLRGKSFEYRLVYPTGESEVLLKVPDYDFNWQSSYYLEKERALPKGTRIECIAHFDNSHNNPANPDATKEVRWGDQSWEEMMIGFFDVAIDTKKDPTLLFRDTPVRSED